jgi:hypothetical protein
MPPVITGRKESLLTQHLDPVILDHGITQDLARDRVQILARLHRDLKILALPDILDAFMAESVERGANGLALWIEDRRFECYVYPGFHFNQCK